MKYFSQSSYWVRILSCDLIKISLTFFLVIINQLISLFKIWSTLGDKLLAISGWCGIAAVC
jgi:hypothetical protein